MLRLLPALALLLPLLSTLVSAQCAACDSYTAALSSCQSTSANVTAVGTTMDTTTIHCMCTTNSGITNMNTCEACDEANPSLGLDITVLVAWVQTCKTDGQFGDQQAAACWEGQPNNYLFCVSRTAGSGSGVGNADGGNDVTTPSALAGATSARNSATGQSATASPTNTATSEAMLSLEAHGLLSVILVGLGMVVGL